MKTNIFKEVKAYNQTIQDYTDTFTKDSVLKDNLKRLLFGSVIIKKEPDKISSSPRARHSLIVLLSTIIITIIFIPLLIIYINIFSIFSPLTFIYKLALVLIPVFVSLLGALLALLYTSILKEEFPTLPSIKLYKIFICEFLKISYWLMGTALAIFVYFIFKLF